MNNNNKKIQGQVAGNGEGHKKAAKAVDHKVGKEVGAKAQADKHAGVAADKSNGSK